tara:strand:+ start:20781 stop:21095 length:315 start_codon:yes stop_codon:yes gene_type:complete
MKDKQMSDNPFQYRMPKRINEPLTLILWPMHYVLMPIMCFGFGILINKPMELLTFGLIWFFTLKYTEERYSRGFILHFLWWHGALPFLKKSKYIPDPYSREYFQ